MTTEMLLIFRFYVEYDNTAYINYSLTVL